VVLEPVVDLTAWKADDSPDGALLSLLAQLVLLFFGHGFCLFRARIVLFECLHINYLAFSACPCRLRIVECCDLRLARIVVRLGVARHLFACVPFLRGLIYGFLRERV
jgi:hypothetical protein